jgi:hypothetical protein
MATDDKLNEFVQRRLKDMDGFTFFDYASKYKIQMAKNWEHLSAPPKKEEGKSTALAPPDKCRDVFDAAESCDHASKTVERCNRANIPLTSAPWVKYGGSPEKLREFPTSPAGYPLDPSTETCTIAAEWHNYCKAKFK